jgi:N-acetyltransferase 10
LHLLTINRYEIEEGAPGWADAERQVLNATRHGQKSATVSVKSTKEKKRKAGESAAEIYAEEFGEKANKKAKKQSKKGRA